MKTALALVLSCAALAIAADDKQQRVKDPSVGPPAQEMKKLGAVTWDPEAHKLSWVVQKGSLVNGQFVATSEQRYEVSPDEATMMTGEERRGIEEQEGNTLHHLLDVLSLYCAESVVWWDEGQGTPLNGAPGTAKPDTKDSKDSKEKPVRVKDEVQPRVVADAVAMARAR